MGAQAGVVGQVELNSPQGSTITTQKSPAFWTYVFFGLACLVVLGFHIRIFGIPLPPAAIAP